MFLLEYFRIRVDEVRYSRENKIIWLYDGKYLNSLIIKISEMIILRLFILIENLSKY